MCLSKIKRESQVPPEYREFETHVVGARGVVQKFREGMLLINVSGDRKTLFCRAFFLSHQLNVDLILYLHMYNATSKQSCLIPAR